MPSAEAASFDCGGDTYASDPAIDGIQNGGFESDFAGWTSPPSNFAPTISTTIVHSGAKSAGVDAASTGSTNTRQGLAGVPDAYVFETWFYVDVWGSGNLFATMLMANWDPGTGSADHVAYIGIESTLVRWIAWKPVAGSGVVQDIPTSLSLDAWHSFDVVVDTTTGTQCLFIDGTYRATASINPSQAWKPDVVLFGDSSYLGDAGIAYYDDLSLDVAQSSRADYAPTNPQPSGPVVAGVSKTLSVSVQVQNVGAFPGNAAATVAFYEEPTPGSPFATFPLPTLGAGETSSPFVTPWTTPSSPGTYRVLVDVDYNGNVVESDEGNNLFTWTISVVPPPQTTLVVGSPSYAGPTTYVTTATLLSLSAQDLSGTGILRTDYRLDGGAWVDYGLTGPFPLPSEGQHLVEYHSEDNVGNVEAVRQAAIRVDDTPPTTIVRIDGPNHTATEVFVTSTALLTLVSGDGGALPVGVEAIEYSWDSQAWFPYSAPFFVQGPDGSRILYFRARDVLGNVEAIQLVRLHLDNTPPATTLTIPPDPLTRDSSFSLSAADDGSGVARIEYSVDGGPWTSYVAPFTLGIDDHVIRYRAVDRLGNEGAERSASVRIENWKPVIAIVFALVLGVVGSFAALRTRVVPAGRKSPWRVILALAVVFAAVEAVTGVVSLATGSLSIPPYLGAGTLVDVAILVAGLAAVLAWSAVARTPPRPSD